MCCPAPPPRSSLLEPLGVLAIAGCSSGRAGDHAPAEACSTEMTVDRILRFFKHLFEGVSVRMFVRVSGYKARAGCFGVRNFLGASWLETNISI